MKTLAIFLILCGSAFAAPFNAAGRPMHQTRGHQTRGHQKGHINGYNQSYVWVNPYIRGSRKHHSTRRIWTAPPVVNYPRTVYPNVDVSAKYGGGPLMIINPFVNQ